MFRFSNHYRTGRFSTSFIVFNVFFILLLIKTGVITACNSIVSIARSTMGTMSCIVRSFVIIFVSIYSPILTEVAETTDNEIFVDERHDLKSDPVVKLVLALHKNSSGLDKRQKNGKAQVQANNWDKKNRRGAFKCLQVNNNFKIQWEH